MRSTYYDPEQSYNYAPSFACLLVEIYAFKSERRSSKDCEHLWLFAEFTKLNVALFRPDGLPVAPTIGGSTPHVLRPGESFTVIWRLDLEWTKPYRPKPAFTGGSLRRFTSRGRAHNVPYQQPARVQADVLAHGGFMNQDFHLRIKSHHTFMPEDNIIQVSKHFHPNELLYRNTRNLNFAANDQYQRFHHLASVLQMMLSNALEVPENPFEYLAIKKSSEPAVMGLLEDFRHAAEPYLDFLRLDTLRDLQQAYHEELSQLYAARHAIVTIQSKHKVATASARHMPAHKGSPMPRQQENSPVAPRRNSIDLDRSELSLDRILDNVTNSSPTKSRWKLGGLRNKLSSLRAVSQTDVPAPLFSRQKPSDVIAASTTNTLLAYAREMGPHGLGEEERAD